LALINERTKLTATAINNVAVTTIATALIAPAVSFVYGPPAAWCAAGVVLHLTARGILGRLRS
jgi:hypothetical protein